MATYAPNMTTLEAQYTRLQGEYTKMVADAQNLKDVTALRSAVTNIKAKNREIQGTLDQMLAAVATSRSSGAELNTRVTELKTKLQQINEDYGKLVSNNDALETLKRIRGYEVSKTNTKVQMYFMAFIGALVLLAIVVFAFGYRKNTATNPTPSMSTATPSLM